MSPYLIRQHQPFQDGYTRITTIGEETHDTGIHFGILKLKANEHYIIYGPLESAYVLLNGQCYWTTQQGQIETKRASLFDEGPIALHLASQSRAEIKALTACEFAVVQVVNAGSFPTTLYQKENLLETEYRGKGLLDDTACRIVRTVFDKRNSPQSNLVLGEVITQPGRWSSYPPHHHVQPEIYHYRFTEPNGFGFAECGHDVFKVRENDTYKILNSNDHAQTSAPGYGMYYLWMIRHLENQPYLVPEFTEDHAWTKSKEANKRSWKGTIK